MIGRRRFPDVLGRHQLDRTGRQHVRDASNGSGTGRINMVATVGGDPVPAGLAGGLIASTNRPFSADTTLTLALAPGS